MSCIETARQTDRQTDTHTHTHTHTHTERERETERQRETEQLQTFTDPSLLADSMLWVSGRKMA